MTSTRYVSTESMPVPVDNQDEQRFETPDSAFAAWVEEDKGFEMLHAYQPTQGARRWMFVLNMGLTLGQHILVCYQKSVALRIENKRKSLVDMTHHKGPRS